MEVDDTGLFKEEQPQPFTMTNASRNSSRRSSRGRKRSLSSKKQSGQDKPKSKLYNVNQRTGRPKSSASKSIGTSSKVSNKSSTLKKPLQDWNDSTMPYSKYFDSKIDPKERRLKEAKEAQERRQIKDAKSTITKASGGAIAVRTAFDEPGKYNVEFHNRNGNVHQAIQIYQNVD